MYFVANADMGLSSQFNQCDLAWDYWQQEGDQVDDERLQGDGRLGKGQGNDQIGRNTVHSNQ